MNKFFVAIAVVATAIGATGCALTHEQIVQRAKTKTNTELCMALIQFPQYSDVVEAELKNRGHICNMGLAEAQLREKNAQIANFQAAMKQASESANANLSSYQIAPPVRLSDPEPLSQIAPLQSSGVTAYFTGKQRQTQTITNQYGWICEYRYASQTFWRTFVGSCPSSVQTQ